MVECALCGNELNVKWPDKDEDGQVFPCMRCVEEYRGQVDERVRLNVLRPDGTEVLKLVGSRVDFVRAGIRQLLTGTGFKAEIMDNEEDA